MDDYCPRERRVTNHAVVAMVGDEVKQTRCTTCDAEHDYKHARVPPQRKKKDVPGALYQQVLDGIPRVVPTPDALENEPDAVVPQVEGDPEPEGDTVPLAANGEPTSEHEGPVHRRLIRATLPRLPGAEPPVRREPEFTMRSPAHTRPGKPKNGFRGGGGMHRTGGPSGQGQGQGQGNGNRGKRHGRPGGDGAWNRAGQPGQGGRGPGGQRPGRGDKKRSR